MNKAIKRAITCAAAVVMMTAACGCSIKVGTNRQPGDSEIMARPGGSGAENADELSVNYLSFKKEYLYWLRSMGITDDSDETVAEECAQRRSLIINYLINEQIIADKARKMGITFTEEELSALEEEYNANIEEQIAYFGQLADFGTADADSISDSEIRARGEQLFDEYLADCLLTRDDLLMWQRSELLTQKVKDEVTKDTAIDRSEAEQTLEEYISGIEEAYNEDPFNYEYNMDSYSSFWVPEGTRRIKHILIKFSDSAADEITDCRRNGDDESADSIREKALESKLDEITEIKNMLDNGSDFDELAQQYSEDSGLAAYPDGYLVIPDGTTYLEEFQQAAFELENIGDYTLAGTDIGWHIVLYAGDARVDPEQLEQYTDYIYEELNANAAEIKFSQTLEEWKAEYAYEIDYTALKIDEPSQSDGAA